MPRAFSFFSPHHLPFILYTLGRLFWKITPDQSHMLGVWVLKDLLLQHKEVPWTPKGGEPTRYR